MYRRAATLPQGHNAEEYTVCLSTKNLGLILNPTDIFRPDFARRFDDESVLLTNEGTQDVTIGVLTAPDLPLSISAVIAPHILVPQPQQDCEILTVFFNRLAFFRNFYIPFTNFNISFKAFV